MKEPKFRSIFGDYECPASEILDASTAGLTGSVTLNKRVSTREPSTKKLAQMQSERTLFFKN